MYEQDMTFMLILGTIFTWTYGLFPPVLIRFVFLKRAIARWLAVIVCVVFWFINVVVFVALGSEAQAQMTLVLVAMVSYLILRHQPKIEKDHIVKIY